MKKFLIMVPILAFIAGSSINDAAAVEGNISITMLPKRIESFSGNSVQITITVANPGAQKLQGTLVLDHKGIPREWLSFEQVKLEVAPGAEKTLALAVVIPFDAVNNRGYLRTTVDTAAGIKSNLVVLDIIQSIVRLDIVQQNILTVEKKHDLTLQLTTRLGAAAHGRISLKAPTAWQVPATLTFAAPEGTARKDFPFSVTPDKPGRYEIVCALEEEGAVGRGNARIAATEQYLVLPPDTVGLLEADLNHDGYPDIAIGNGKAECLVTTVAGGRILALINPATGRNQLWTQYPMLDEPYKDDDTWVEYGGINDVLERKMPGAIGNNTWVFKILSTSGEKAAFQMSCITPDGLAVAREISLAKSSPTVRMDYTFTNQTDKDKSLVWNSHPNMACGGTTDNNLIRVTTKDGVQEVPFEGAGGKALAPVDNTCLSYNAVTGEFVRHQTDLAESGLYVYQSADFYTVEFSFKAQTLKPGVSKTFFIDYTLGVGVQ